eukprot:3042387-Rhodomonas_salina.1
MFRGVDKNGNHVPLGHNNFELDTHDITAAIQRSQHGCISVGTNANVLVPEYVIYLQTGHALPGQCGQPAGRQYMHINNPKVLFSLWEQFEL